MASSAASFNTSSHNSQDDFSFSTQMMSSSFTDLLSSGGDMDHSAPFAWALSDPLSHTTEFPKFKSLPPPSLPISPPPVSPSSYFAFSSGFSSTDLLDSPLLLSSSNVSQMTLSLLFLMLLPVSLYCLEFEGFRLTGLFRCLSYAGSSVSNHWEFCCSGLQLEE